MSAGHEFFEHTADVGVRIRGANPTELFEQAAAALYAALGQWQAGGPPQTRQWRLSATDYADLLHDWLSELLFLFETRQLLFGEFTFEQLSPTGLVATGTGWPIDPAASSPHQEIKAVTYHRLEVGPQPDGQWQATVIFDV